jgi:hypothetical protein
MYSQLTDKERIITDSVRTYALDKQNNVLSGLL